MLSVNDYFSGKVKSIAFDTATLPATVGVISEGEYEFNTSQHETMSIVSGELSVLLPGQTQWQVFAAGSQFEVPANARFSVRSGGNSAYLCTYA